MVCKLAPLRQKELYRSILRTSACVPKGGHEHKPYAVEGGRILGSQLQDSIKMAHQGVPSNMETERGRQAGLKGMASPKSMAFTWPRSPASDNKKFSARAPGSTVH